MLADLACAEAKLLTAEEVEALARRVHDELLAARPAEEAGEAEAGEGGEVDGVPLIQRAALECMCRVTKTHEGAVSAPPCSPLLSCK